MEKEKMVKLVRKVQRGEPEAAGQLYEVFQPDIYYFILKTVNNDPELAADLTQDTFIEILDTIGKLEEPAAFVAWSQRIAYHRCTGYFRKRHELLADENEDGQTIFDTMVEEREEFIPDEALNKEDLRNTILSMVSALPEEQRTAIMLRYYNEVSVGQIAQIQGVSEGTVKSRLNYGRKAIKQAVESYEKKSGVKLRCAGVVPLLLWMFREYAKAKGLSITTKVAHTAAAAAGGAAGSSAGGSTAATGIKAAGIFAAKKLIAGIVAAVMVLGGAITAFFVLKPEPEPAFPRTWCAYGDANFKYMDDDYFRLTVDYMDDEKLEGTLEAQYHHKTFFQTKVTGEGQVNEDGQVVYQLSYTDTYVYEAVLRFEYNEIQAVYDKNADTFMLDDHFKVCLVPEGSVKSEELAKNANWSGVGKDVFYPGFTDEGHDFQLQIQELTTTQVKGRLIVSYNGQVDHDTTFTGRGYERDGVIYYDVVLDTPRVEEDILTFTLEAFWLEYDMENDTMRIDDIGTYYRVEMQRDK